MHRVAGEQVVVFFFDAEVAASVAGDEPQHVRGERVFGVTALKVRLEGDPVQAVIIHIFHLLDELFERIGNAGVHVILNDNVLPRFGRIGDFVEHVFIGQAEIGAEDVRNRFGIGHIGEAHAHFVHRPITGKQMTVAVVDLAALRVKGVKLTGV